jgi:hypothetical protein
MGSTEGSVRSRGLCVSFVTCLSFYDGKLLAPRPTAKLKDHLFSLVRDRLFNIFSATLHNWRPFLHPQPEDAPCRGDMDPRIMCLDSETKLKIKSNFFSSIALWQLCRVYLFYCHLFFLDSAHRSLLNAIKLNIVLGRLVCVYQQVNYCAVNLYFTNCKVVKVHYVGDYITFIFLIFSLLFLMERQCICRELVNESLNVMRLYFMLRRIKMDFFLPWTSVFGYEYYDT